MFVNGKSLLDAAPFKTMESAKQRFEGTSYGLAEAGYDLRINQDVNFYPPNTFNLMEIMTRGDVEEMTDYDRYEMQKAHLGFCVVTLPDGTKQESLGRFVMASAMEEFQMPADLVGNIKDKSTWARLGLSVFNTVAEPKWNGFLTLELVFHGNDPVEIKAGQGIAQVLFGRLEENGDYGEGKYQNAADKIQGAILTPDD